MRDLKQVLDPDESVLPYVVIPNLSAVCLSTQEQVFEIRSSLWGMWEVTGVPKLCWRL